MPSIVKMGLNQNKRPPTEPIFSGEPDWRLTLKIAVVASLLVPVVDFALLFLL